MNRKIAYRAACARTRDARERLLTSVQAARNRVAPARLRQDAAAGVVGAAMDGAAYAAAKARQRPIATGGAIAALLLYLARRPLAALFGRLYVRIRPPQTEVSETDNG